MASAIAFRNTIVIKIVIKSLMGRLWWFRLVVVVVVVTIPTAALHWQRRTTFVPRFV
jgi:hypothetical protein